MRFSVPLALLASSASSALAAPAVESQDVHAGLSLIKTSPEDPGRWVTEEQKITEYKSKGIGFVDITGITDASVLAALSTPDVPEEKVFSVQAAAAYPSSVSHQSVANPLLANVSTTSSKSWLKTLTEYVDLHHTLVM